MLSNCIQCILQLSHSSIFKRNWYMKYPVSELFIYCHLNSVQNLGMQKFIVITYWLVNIIFFEVLCCLWLFLVISEESAFNYMFLTNVWITIPHLLNWLMWYKTEGLIFETKCSNFCFSRCQRLNLLLDIMKLGVIICEEQKWPIRSQVWWTI